MRLLPGRLARLAPLVLLVAAAGCMYSLVGGGLPPHIRSITVEPFENATPQPLLGTDVQQALQLTVPRNLGVRLGGEQTSDAVVRGRVTGYEEVATSVRPSDNPQQVPVLTRQVRITFEAEIYDLVNDRAIWRASSQGVLGNFQPTGGETAVDGRARAIDELVQKVIEGAQSQW